MLDVSGVPADSLSFSSDWVDTPAQRALGGVPGGAPAAAEPAGGVRPVLHRRLIRDREVRDLVDRSSDNEGGRRQPWGA
jgi:hypothetical protein